MYLFVNGVDAFESLYFRFRFLLPRLASAVFVQLSFTFGG